MSGDHEAGGQEPTEQLRQENIGRLSLHLFRAFNSRALGMLRERGHAGLTLAHTSLLINLDTEGIRITDLADRAGVSKQAMGRLVHDLERAGYVGRSIDPTDGRATIVSFTAQGRQFLQDAANILREIEAEYALALGQESFSALRSSMLALVRHAEQRAD